MTLYCCTVLLEAFVEEFLTSPGDWRPRASFLPWFSLMSFVLWRAMSGLVVPPASFVGRIERAG
jgi:hypothetical protein